MSLNNILALSGATMLLAAIPSTSVLTTIARAASFGFIHGVFVAIGIVIGDLIFISIALGGLSLFAAQMSGSIALIKYLGGAYLIWIGISLYRSRHLQFDRGSNDSNEGNRSSSSLFSSLSIGLFITLADQKAILFYLGFFPAFLDLNRISTQELTIVIINTIVCVGGVKIFYAAIADRAVALIDRRIQSQVKIAAALVTISIGIYLMFKQ
jgi:threonine/homoserine/homoserine lactone efflux protein